MKKTIFYIFLISCLTTPGIGYAAGMKVFVSIVPQKYFVEKIGGRLVDVSIMIPPQANPHNYEPKPRQMTALARAKVYFAIGVNFENVWLKKLTKINKEMAVVHSEKGIKKIPMARHGHHEENHDHANHKGHEDHSEYDHGAMDPHVWTSPKRVKVIARNILNGLVLADPENKGAYEDGYDKFNKELEELDAAIKNAFKDKEGFKFMVFHPAWGYLAHDYGLRQVPVEIEGKEPKPAQLARLIEHAREEGVKVIFVQPQMSGKSAETIAKAIGGQVYLADPLAADWGNNLKKQAELFKAAAR